MRGLYIASFAAAAAAALTPAVARAHGAAVLDLAWYFPNAQMARTHYLCGSQPGTDWHLTSVGGDFTLWRLGNEGGSRGDLYFTSPTDIALIGHTYAKPDGGLGVIQYLGGMFHKFPAFPRFLDLSTLPLSMTQPSAWYLHDLGDGTKPVSGQTEPLPIQVDIAEDSMLHLQWGDLSGHYETLWIGDVPIHGADDIYPDSARITLTAPGIVRYQTSIIPGLDTWFSWCPR